MTREVELAKAVLEYDETCRDPRCSIDFRICLKEKMFAIAKVILASQCDAPTPQPAADVVKMRDEILRLKKVEAVADAMIEGLDDKLESCHDQLQRCRLAQVQQNEQDTELRRRLHILESQLKPAKVDWAELGKIAQGFYIKSGGWIPWHELARKVIEAYERSRATEGNDGEKADD